MQKVWRFKNVGTVTWSGYVLHRMDEPPVYFQIIVR